MGKMSAKLMFASGFRLQFHQAVARGRVTSGQGDLPDSIVPLFQGIKDSLGFQPNLRYGVIALGDSSYVNFCNGGKQFDALLQEQSAQRVGEMLLIDASENPECARRQ